MATKTLKAAVELSGEAKYKEASKSLSTDNKVLSSEMRKLKAEFKGQTDSMEFLTRKGELLNKELDTQKARVDTLRAAVAHAKEQYGAAAEETKEWIAKLNNAEAQQFNLEHAIEENNEALENQGKSMTGLGDIAEKFADKLGIKIPDGAKKALNGVKGFSTGTVAAMGVAAAAVGATTLAYKKLFDLALEQGSLADETLNKALASGISPETVQALEYASSQINVSFDAIQDGIKSTTEKMYDAQQGSEELANIFRSLGVAIEDSNGQLRDSYTVYQETLDALGQMENVTERNATAQKLYGDRYMEMIPIIEEGTGALRKYTEEAVNSGYVLDEYQLKRLQEVDDAYQRMQLTVEANRKQLAVEFAPAAIEAMTVFSEFVTKAGKALVDSGIITGLGSILESTLGIIGASGDLSFENFGKTLNTVAQLLAGVADLLDFVKSVVTLDFRGVANAIGLGYGSGNPNNVQRVKMQQTGQWEYYSSHYGYNASGNDNWQGGMTYINEAGPEAIYLPRGTQITTAQETRELGGDTFNFYIDAKNVQEFIQLVEMAKSARIRSRMKGEK